MTGIESKHPPFERGAILGIFVLGLQLFFPSLPTYSFALTIALAGGLYLILNRAWGKTTFLWLAFILLPFLLTVHSPRKAPSSDELEQAIQDLIPELSAESLLKDHRETLIHWSDHENEIFDIFHKQSERDGLSYTLVDLNMTPKIWAGQAFSDDYQNLTSHDLFWIFKDNRAFLNQLIPLPDSEKTLCYLITESLVISGNPLDRPLDWFESLWRKGPKPPVQWISKSMPESRYFQPFFTLRKPDSAPEGDKVLNALPVEIKWISYQNPHLLTEWSALIWVFLFLFWSSLFFKEVSGKPAYQRILCYGFLFVLLTLPLDISLDYLEVFSSNMFGALNFGNLLISPFHLCVGLFLLFQVGKEGLAYYSPGKKSLLSHLSLGLQTILPFTLFIAAYFPTWMEHNSPVTLSQPKEAFLSPGSFLVFFTTLTALSLFAGYLLRAKMKTKSRVILFIVLGIAWLVMPLSTWVMAASLALITLLSNQWLFKRRWLTQLLAALLLMSGYTFQLNAKGTRKLHAYIQKEWLQEMTLLEQANHNRITRLLDAFREYCKEYPTTDNAYLATWLVKTSGISEEAVGYAVWVMQSDGRVSSVAESQVSLENIPFELFSSNRIEYYQETVESPKILIFRKPFELKSEMGELVIAITNSYQDLTSIRRLSPMFRKEGLEVPFKHGQVTLKVFDLDGNPLNDFKNSTVIPHREFERLDHEPFFFENEGPKTTYFFNNGNQKFMLEVFPPSPLILLARLVLLFGFCWGVLLLIHRFSKLKRRQFREQLRRSFRFRLANLFFMVGFLPMALGMVLFYIQLRNQQYEKEIDLVIDKIYRTRTGIQAGKPLGLANPEDLSIFKSGSLAETTRPELFRSSTLATRLPYQMYRQLIDNNVSHLIQRIFTNESIALNAVYLKSGPDTILGMTGYSDTLMIREHLKNKVELISALALVILFCVSFLALSVSRAFLKPIASVTRAAAKLQHSRKQDPLPTFQHQDELNRMIQAFNSMRQTILWNEKERQKQIDLLTITLETMKTGLLGFNHDNQVILVNKAVFQLLPKLKPLTDNRVIFSVSEIVPKTSLEPTQKLSQDDVLEYVPELESILTSTKSKSETLQIPETGSERILLVQLEKREDTNDPQEIETILLIEDITPEMETSRLKAWSEMARRIAHEIKNPLTPIQLEIDHLNALYRDGHPEFSKALDETTSEIKRQVQQLHKTATDFGDFARPMSVEPVELNLSTILEDCLRSYQKNQSKLIISTVIDDDPVMHLDPKLTRKAISNLIINSFEALQKGHLDLHLFTRPATNDSKSSGPILTLSIQDDGPGIPFNEIDRIFEAYFSTKTRGTGLGLAIARKSIEIQGGKLRLDPDIEKGARFLIEFPIKGKTNEK